MTYNRGSWGTYAWDPSKTREENLLSAEKLGAAVTKSKMDNIEDGIADAHTKNRELEQLKADKVELQNLDKKKADNNRVDALEREKADITFVESMAEGQVNNIDLVNARKEDKTYVDNEIGKLDTKKADKSYVDSENQKISTQIDNELDETNRQLEQQYRENEQVRADAENVREANETTRQAEETQREANEQNRVTAENERNDLYDLVQQKLENDEFVGEKGDKGDTGETGSLEELTKDHVETALGYVPADEANLSTDSVTLQGRTPSNFIEVVNHGTTSNYARPVGGISVLWIGTVEPQNAIDNDIWIGGL